MLDSLFRITDRFGNDYAATAISIPPTPNLGAGGDSLLPDSAKMTAGMFTLYFEDVMNQNPNLNSFRNAAARNLAVRVYSDLSAMLDYAGAAGRVRIYIRESETQEGAAAMSGSSFYLLPKSQRQALVYGDVWKAIVTGSGHSIFGEKYHGFMKLNSAYLYQFEPDAPFATGNEYDLYTIFLHQALQILGLNTAMDMNDAFYTYASRYDLHLQDANHTNLVTLNEGLPTCNATIPVTGGCNTIYFEGTNTPQQLMYSPTTWEEGNSLSEVNCTASGCNTDAFVMKHCIGAGNTFALRHPHLREVQMLADIGYKLTGVYGLGGSSSFLDYNTTFSVMCASVGIDDQISSPSGQVAIVDVLGNDIIGGTPAGISIVSVYPPVFGTAIVSGNQIEFTPATIPFPPYGGILIIYNPMCGGTAGNPTLLRIWMTPPRCSVSTNCGENLINCGGFECITAPENY